MKKLFGWCAAVALAGASLAGQENATDIRAGMGRVDITPPLGAFIPGYFSQRLATGVGTPLTAECLAFSDGRSEALVYTVDNLHLTKRTIDALKAKLKADWGIPPELVFVHSTHIHTGAATDSSYYREIEDEKVRALCDAYGESLVPKMVQAAERARDDLKPAKFRFARGEVRPAISFIRRYRMKDGTVVTNPSRNHPERVADVLGEADNSVQVVRLVREGAPDIALVNFQTHPDTVGGLLYHADWPGDLRATFEKALGDGTRLFFMNGAQGDTNHFQVLGENPFWKGHPFSDYHAYMGRAVAGAALEAWNRTQPVEATGGICGVITPTRVASNRPDAARIEAIRLFDAGRKDEIRGFGSMEIMSLCDKNSRARQLMNGPDWFEMPVSALSVGGVLAFAGFPGEPFTEIGSKVKSGSPFPMTFVGCLVNDSFGYLPSSSAAKEGGYEVVSSRFGATCGDTLVRVQLENLMSLRLAEGTEWKFQWPAVIPAVAEHECRADVQVALDADLAVEVTCADGAKGAAWVAGKMSAWFGGLAFAVRDVAGAVDDLAENPEAYALEAEKGRLVIRARTLKGVRWAMMTLRQIAQPVRGTFGRLAYEVPAFRMKDAPETAFRALHLCAFPEVTIPRLEHGIRMAAYYKFNYVIVESWGVFRSERQPWYGWKDGKLTVAECRRLAAVAQDLGVTLIPFFNVFGHATATRGKSGKNAILDMRPEYQGMFEPVAGFNWCLSNPHVRQAICDLVGELHDAFGRPPYFHLGCDEADPPSCAACCAADYGRLLADHVTALADFVRRRGARPMIWHDMLVKEGDPRWKGFYAHGTDATVSLLDRLPKDVIICDWWYDDPPKDGKYPTLEHFRAKGFTTVTCPWDNVPGIVSQCDYARRNGLGVIGTTWNRFTSYRVWEMYPYSAAGAWSTAAARDVEKVAARYGTFLRDVFGTHWRQVGYDTPGVDTYSEFGYFTDQVGVSIHER